MKFSVSSGELLKVLTKASAVVPSKSTLPILENFLFELSKNELSVTATDLEISITATLGVEGKEDGKMVIPAKRIMETVRALPNVALQLVGDPAAKKLTMATDQGEYHLTGEATEDYPTIPHIRGTEELAVESQTLARMIGKTSFAVSTDELRPAMMGVLLQIKKNSLGAVSTDGHRLVRMSDKSFASPQIERDVIVPAKALNVVAKSLEGESNKVSLEANHIVFCFDSTTVISRLIEEKYPNYDAVIPTDSNKVLTINRADLLSAVRRIGLYASSTTHQVRFSLKKESLIVSAEDIDFGSDATETLPCGYTGEAIELGFNGNYLVDILSHIDADEVKFFLSTATRAVIVKPAEQQKDEDILMLVMPVRLNA
jgi:DNA polymerase-3 subunit beta